MGTLVLERLGPQNDALVGDLAEEYQAGALCGLVLVASASVDRRGRRSSDHERVYSRFARTVGSGIDRIRPSAVYSH